MNHLKYFVSFAIILSSFIAVDSQTPAEQARIEQVQEIVGTLIGTSNKAAVLLTSLDEVSGYVTSLDGDGFEIRTDRKARRGARVSYSDVLAMSSKKGSVSFVPDPKTSLFGAWSDIKKLPINAFIEVTVKNGKITSGRFRSSGADSMVLAHLSKNDEWTFSQADIAYLHRVKHGWRDMSGSISSGAQKGEKIGKGVGKVMGGMKGPISGASTGDGRGGLGSVIGAGIGAGVGAAKGSADKTDSLKVLVYSP